MANGTDITAALNLQFVGASPAASSMPAQAGAPGSTPRLVPSFAAILGSGSPSAEPLSEGPASGPVPGKETKPRAGATVAPPVAPALDSRVHQSAGVLQADAGRVVPSSTVGGEVSVPDADGVALVTDVDEDETLPVPVGSQAEPAMPIDSTFTALIATLVFAVPMPHQVLGAPPPPVPATDVSSAPSVCGRDQDLPVGAADGPPAGPAAPSAAHSGPTATHLGAPLAFQQAVPGMPSSVLVAGVAPAPPVYARGQDLPVEAADAPSTGSAASSAIHPGPTTILPSAPPALQRALSGTPGASVLATQEASTAKGGIEQLPVAAEGPAFPGGPGRESEDSPSPSGLPDGEGESLLQTTRQMHLRASLALPFTAGPMPPPASVQYAVSPAKGWSDAEMGAPLPVSEAMAGGPQPTAASASPLAPSAGSRAWPPSSIGVTEPFAQDDLLPLLTKQAVAVPSTDAQVAFSEAPALPEERVPPSFQTLAPPLSPVMPVRPPVAPEGTLEPLTEVPPSVPASPGPRSVAAAAGLPMAPSAQRRPSAPDARDPEAAVASGSAPALAPLPPVVGLPVPHHAPLAEPDAASGPWHPVTVPDGQVFALPESAALPAPSEEARLRQPELAVQMAGVEAERVDAPAPVSQQPVAALLPAGRAETSQQPQPVANPVERMVVRQVSRALVRTTPTGDRSLVIRLTPPELGTVRIEFIERDGAVTARIHADDPAVRQALDRLLPQVRGELRAADSPVQQITVSAGSSSDQAFDGRGFDGRGAHQQQQRQEPAGNGPRARRGDRPVFSLDGGAAPIEASATSAPRSRVSDSIVDALA